VSPLDTTRTAKPLRADLQLIADMVAPGSRVLDIGCGEGALLEYLARERRVIARGMELSQKNVNASVARGLSVIQGDADTDLGDYPSGAFDYAILSLTLQATRDPREVVEQMVRIGRHAIVSFPNFGHWRVRLGLLLSEVGRLNQIEVAQDEVNRALFQEAQRHPGQEQQVVEFYRNNPEALAQLRAPLFEDKVIDFIIDLAQVSEREVTPDQLREEEEKAAEAAEKPKKAAAKKKPAKKAAAKSKAKAADEKGGEAEAGKEEA